MPPVRLRRQEQLQQAEIIPDLALRAVKRQCGSHAIGSGVTVGDATSPWRHLVGEDASYGEYNLFAKIKGEIVNISFAHLVGAREDHGRDRQTEGCPRV